MLQHERVADNVYFFQSELYAQVTAGVISGPDMAVLIDTLPFPEETLQVRDFVERELQVPVRYIVNTHYHADHSWGNYLFPGAIVISHTLGYGLQEERGIPSLEVARKDNNSFRAVKIVLPHITFEEGELSLQVGKKLLKIFSFPGHSYDSIAVLVEDDRVLFAGDTIMPLPYIVDGDFDDTVASHRQAGKMGLENIIQGHGDIVLRGEIDAMLKDNLEYLSEIRKAVRQAGRRKYALDLLREVTVEECGKSRVLIGGLAEELHRRNLVALYKQIFGKPPKGSDSSSGN